MDKVSNTQWENDYPFDIKVIQTEIKWSPFQTKKKTQRISTNDLLTGYENQT